MFAAAFKHVFTVHFLLSETALKGSITNAGPCKPLVVLVYIKADRLTSTVDASISFPSGLTISWEGKPIGQVSMNDIQVTGDVGGTIDTQANFQVADVDHLADFTKVCFNICVALTIFNVIPGSTYHRVV